MFFIFVKNLVFVTVSVMLDSEAAFTVFLPVSDVFVIGDPSFPFEGPIFVFLLLLFHN